MRDRLANPGAAGIYSDTSAASIYSDTSAAKRQVDSGNLVITFGVRPCAILRLNLLAITPV